MYKKDLALNNLQWLICHQTKPNQTKPNHIYLIHYIYIYIYIYIYKGNLALNNLQWLICHQTNKVHIIEHL